MESFPVTEPTKQEHHLSTICSLVSLFCRHLFLTSAVLGLWITAGDSPDEVKARLKYWAQAVACTVRLCS
jgi:hypothetical protein